MFCVLKFFNYFRTNPIYVGDDVILNEAKQSDSVIETTSDTESAPSIRKISDGSSVADRINLFNQQKIFQPPKTKVQIYSNSDYVRDIRIIRPPIKVLTNSKYVGQIDINPNNQVHLMSIIHETTKEQ